MKIELLEEARQFCRDHDVSNVGLVHQAMLRGAEIATEECLKLVTESAGKLEYHRAHNLNPGSKS